MRATFTIFLALTASTVFGQEFTFEYGDENYMNWHYNCSIDYGYTFKKRLPDGKYLGYHPENSDQILVEAFYSNRKKHGDWITYRPKDKIKELRHYENGVLLTEKFVDSLGRVQVLYKHNKSKVYIHYYSYYLTGELKGDKKFGSITGGQPK